MVCRRGFIGNAMAFAALGGCISSSEQKAEGFAAPGATLVCETDCDIPPKATRLRKDEDAAAEAILRDVFGGDGELAARYTVLKSPLYGRTRITLLTPRGEEIPDGEGSGDGTGEEEA